MRREPPGKGEKPVHFTNLAFDTRIVLESVLDLAVHLTLKNTRARGRRVLPDLSPYAEILALLRKHACPPDYGCSCTP